MERDPVSYLYVMGWFLKGRVRWIQEKGHHYLTVIPVVSQDEALLEKFFVSAWYCTNKSAEGQGDMSKIEIRE